MIFVFKTNINTKEQADSLKDAINNSFPASKWNFDLEDCDRIFRIESINIDVNLMISVFNKHGFSCEELSDLPFSQI